MLNYPYIQQFLHSTQLPLFQKYNHKRHISLSITFVFSKMMLQIKTIPHQHTSIVYKIRCHKSTILVECGRKKKKKNPERAGNLHTMLWRAVLNFLTRGLYLRQVRRCWENMFLQRNIPVDWPTGLLSHRREAVLLSSFLSQPAYSRVAVNTFRVIANQWFFVLFLFYLPLGTRACMFEKDVKKSFED